MKWGLPARGPGRWLAAGSFAGAAGLGSVVPFTAVYFTRMLVALWIRRERPRVLHI